MHFSKQWTFPFLLFTLYWYRGREFRLFECNR